MQTVVFSISGGIIKRPIKTGFAVLFKYRLFKYLIFCLYSHNNIILTIQYFAGRHIYYACGYYIERARFIF